MKTLKQLFSYFKPYMGIIILNLIMGIIMVLLAMLIPMTTKFIIASVIGDTPFSFMGYTPSSKTELLWVLSIAWILVVILRQGIAYLRTYMMTVSSIKAVTTMREDCFKKIIWQSLSFLRQENTGNLMSILTFDTEVVKNLFTTVVPSILEALLGFFIASIILFQRNPLVVIVVYFFAVPLFIILRKCSKVFRYHFGFVRDSQAALRMNAQENIVGMRIIKSFAQEDNECNRFDKFNVENRDNYLKYNKITNLFDIPFTVLHTLVTVVVSFVCFLLIVNTNEQYLSFSTTITIAEYVEITGYIAYILVPFLNMNWWLNYMQQALTGAERTLKILNAKSLISSLPDAKACDNTSVDLSFNGVTLSVEGKKLIDNISFELPQGKSLGIMGATGSGKTVLVNLLMRFYDPTNGNVLINSVDARKLSLESVRKCFSPVSQGSFLFSDTIKNNILYGNPDATDAQVEFAAKAAQAYDFILSTPDGFETIIGERGMGLSGGQRQRVAIARALLYDAPVMIFDDATSALDMETEKRLYAALNAHFNKKSKVIIAHRVSSVKNCDEIIILEKGKILERGSHQELIKQKGRYYEIYLEQYGSLASDEEVQ